jgi:hypothetical protein
MEASAMTGGFVRSKTLGAATVTLLAAFAGICLQHASFAMDGISGCSVSETEADSKRMWHHTIMLQVPEGKHCRVSVGDDRDLKAWTYCWVKGAEANPVSATCDDPIDNPDFDTWRARAACDNQNFMAYCRRE